MLVKWHVLMVQPNTSLFGPGILSKSLGISKLQVPCLKNRDSGGLAYHRVFGVFHIICMKMSRHYKVKNIFWILNNSFYPKGRGACNYLSILIRIMVIFLSSPTSVPFFQNHSLSNKLWGCLLVTLTVFRQKVNLFK